MQLFKKLNEAQKIAAMTYGGGEYADARDLEEAELTMRIENCGDTLFKFVMVELDDSEDCDNLETAANRIESAISDLAKVHAALDAET